MKSSELKITAFIGSARKKNTYNFTDQFLKNLQSFGHIKYEIIFLSDYNLKTCTGCQLCFNKGEEFCPLKDDRDLLLKKIKDSDGIIFATPNYSFQVSGLMKVFFDRLAFNFHRPQFFGKTYTSIVTQGIYGGKDIVKYLDFIGTGLGFNVVHGCCLTTLEPITEKNKVKINSMLKKQSEKFYSRLIKEKLSTPTLFELMIFRCSRTRMKVMLDENFRDHQYFKKKGWFESDYYYPVKISYFKKQMGIFFDFITFHMTKKR